MFHPLITLGGYFLNSFNIENGILRGVLFIQGSFRHVSLNGGVFQQKVVTKGGNFLQLFEIIGGSFDDLFIIQKGQFFAEFNIEGGEFKSGFKISGGNFKNNFSIRDGFFEDEFQVEGGEFDKTFGVKGGEFDKVFKILKGIFNYHFTITYGDFKDGFLVNQGTFNSEVNIYGGVFRKEFTISGGVFFNNVFVGGDGVFQSDFTISGGYYYRKIRIGDNNSFQKRLIIDNENESNSISQDKFIAHLSIETFINFILMLLENCSLRQITFKDGINSNGKVYIKSNQVESLVFEDFINEGKLELLGVKSVENSLTIIQFINCNLENVVFKGVDFNSFNQIVINDTKLNNVSLIVFHIPTDKKRLGNEVCDNNELIHNSKKMAEIYNQLYLATQKQGNKSLEMRYYATYLG